MGSKPGKVRKQMRSTLSAGYPWGKLELSAAGGLWDTVWNPAQHCPPKGGGMFVLCLHLSSAGTAPWSTYSWHSGPAPQDRVPGRSAGSSGRTPHCVLERVLSRAGGPQWVGTARCYCIQVSHLISPDHFYLSSFKYKN